MKVVRNLCVAAVLGLGLTACGGGDDDGETIVDELMEQFDNQSGIEANRECVEELILPLSDGDKEKLLGDASTVEELDLTDKGAEAVGKLSECLKPE